MKIAVISTPQLARGFALLGVESYGVEDAASAKRRVDELVKRDDIGLVLVAERYYVQLQDELLKMRLEVERPVIMDIPDMIAPHRKLDFVADFVLRNTGISIT
ncbi:MAG TPA: V-type ATP synthase subunit F [bacterium]|nr:V-type ATP synthase subunit F [bacterium]